MSRPPWTLALNALAVVVVGLDVLMSSVTPAQSSDPLGKADLVFNSGNFERAYDLYGDVRQRAKSMGDNALAAEALNSMAATQLMLGQPLMLLRLRRAADQEKRQLYSQRLLAPSETPSAGIEGNLIVDGSFEDGLVPPWGGGHYEREKGEFRFGIWWNSANAQAFMKIDSDVRFSGKRSLRLTNLSPAKPHVFSTTSQRITGLHPNTIYRITMRIKAEQIRSSAISLAIDAGWEKRLPSFPAGTYDWRLYSAVINIGHNDYIDLRFIHQDTGTVWIDDVVVTPAKVPDENLMVIAEALFDRAQYKEALALYRRIERESPSLQSRARVARGRILTVVGRYDEALKLLRPMVNDASPPLIRLAIADLFKALGQHALALDHYSRAAKSLTGNQGGLARVRQRMGEVYLAAAAIALDLDERQRMRDSASLVLSQALRVMRHIGEKNGEAQTLRSIARLLRDSGKLDEARRTVINARPIAESVGNNVLASDLLLDEVEFDLEIGVTTKRRQTLETVLERKRQIGDQLGIIRALEITARMHLMSGDIDNAFAKFEAAAQKLDIAFSGLTSASAEMRQTFIEQFRLVLRGHIEAGLALYRRRPQLAGKIVDSTFRMAQWAQFNAASTAIARMAARASAGTDTLSRLARRRQDLETRLEALRKALRSSLSRPTGQRNPVAEANLKTQITSLESSLRAIDDEIQAKFPQYAGLANPRPLPIEKVREQLDQHEALLLLFETEDKAFAWLVKKSATRWRKLELAPTEIREAVQTLRCGLDATSWTGLRALRCLELLDNGIERMPSEGELLPFDARRAHDLYKTIFGAGDYLTDIKHLLVVPSGSLTALPFQVLVSKSPAVAVSSRPADLSRIEWLGQSHALSVLPSVASLSALRAEEMTSRAARAFIGFGNPLLTGEDGKDRRAWSKQRCPTLVSQQRPYRMKLAKLGQTISSFFRGGLANVEEIRRQTPLPETADELCSVARSRGLANPDKAVFLGARATETQVKKLSADGTLARYKVVHFATHGLIAGETASFVASNAEPSLLLTPSDEASQLDDGLLTASEVTTLKLDAEWVILSACNTASGDTVGGDAFSGLARAFFYAGARALLVSHWYVDSQATVALITSAFEQIGTSSKMYRSEALRRAMVQLIASGGANSHPEKWSPFVVVGEGGALQ